MTFARPWESRLRACTLAMVACSVVGVEGPVARAEDAPVVVDRIAAVVGHEVVLYSEVREHAEPFYAKALAGEPDAAARAEKRTQVERAVLLELVDRRLVALGAPAGMEVHPDEVNMAVGLLAQDGGVTREKFLEAAAQQGTSEADLREAIAYEILVDKIVLARIRKRTFSTPREREDATNEEKKAWLAALHHRFYVDVRL